jgi:hypothetical protein
MLIQNPDMKILHVVTVFEPEQHISFTSSSVLIFANQNVKIWYFVLNKSAFLFN